ncbi:acetyltransferase, GNAT family protein, partial [Streptomyces sp. e14]
MVRQRVRLLLPGHPGRAARLRGGVPDIPGPGGLIPAAARSAERPGVPGEGRRAAAVPPHPPPGRRAGLCETARMIRTAIPADVPVIHALIRELAEYEKALDEARATPEQLTEALFGERPAAYAHVAEDAGGEVVGFALWFLNFSTWRGVHGIYL